MDKSLYTFLIAMVPVIELRGALPIGVGFGLTPLQALILSVAGNIVPVPIIMLTIRKILELIKKTRLKKIALKIEEKAEKHKDKIEKYGAAGLFILVAVPLPGTGAWTGALVAALADIRMKKAIPVIATGVVAAGIIVFMLTYGVISIF